MFGSLAPFSTAHACATRVAQQPGELQSQINLVCDFRERKTNDGWRRRSETCCDWLNFEDRREGQCGDYAASLDQNGGCVTPIRCYLLCGLIAKRQMLPTGTLIMLAGQKVTYLARGYFTPAETYTARALIIMPYLLTRGATGSVSADFTCDPWWMAWRWSSLFSDS